jgi:hypothetical protein
MQTGSSVVALAILAVATSVVRADVTIDEKIDVSAIGGFSLAAMQGTNRTLISAERARTDSNLEFKSKLMRTFAGKSGGTAQIVRLDQDRIIDIDFAHKQYTEMTFAESRQATEAAIAKYEQSMKQQQQAGGPGGSALPVDEEQCDWSPPQVTAGKTGQSATIAGINAEEARVSMTRTCTDRKTGKACDMTFSIDQWLAKDSPGGVEARKFWENYARRLGYDETTAQSMKARYQQLFSQYESAWKEVAAKTQDFEGFPVKSILEMRIGGATCTTDDGEPISDSLLADATEAGLDAGASTVAGAAGSVAAQKAAEEAGYGVGGSVAGSAAGAFAGKLASGLFGKKKKKPAAEPAVQPATAKAPGSVTLFRVLTETTSIGTGTVPVSEFEVPAGLKKVTNPLLAGG